MSCQLPSVSDAVAVGVGSDVGSGAGDNAGMAVGPQEVRTRTRINTDLRNKNCMVISRQTVIYVESLASIACAGSRKLLTLSTLLVGLELVV